MLIVRNSVRLTALVAGLALAGCGSQSGDHFGGSGDCDPDAVKQGCVAMFNFRSTAQELNGLSVPGRAGSLPGKKGVMLSDSSVNSTHTYQGTIGGLPVNVTCTVTSLGWISVNPTVVIQQEAFGAEVDCQNW
jgi:hypothetical protein